MAPIAHHLDGEIDGVAHILQACDAAGAQRGALHDAGVQLDITVGVQAGAYAGVEKWLVLHVADGGDRRGQRAITDPRPAKVQRALDGFLAVWALGGRNRSRTAVDYERGSGQGFASGRLEGAPVHEPAIIGPPVRNELDPTADGGPLGRSPLSEPALLVHTPDAGPSFDPTHNLFVAGHHDTLPRDFEVLDAIAL
jgi:hypothetical protein